MKLPKRLHEDYEAACRALAERVCCERDRPRQLMLIRDFVSKSSSVRPEVRFRLALESLRPVMPTEVHPMVSKLLATPPSGKPHADVAIVTVIKEELLATQLVFGIDPERREDREVNGLRYWEVQLPSDVTQHDQKVVVTMVGEARNVPCAIACDRLFNTYQVDAAILVGIAAGLKTKVSHGDVVAADLVLDYEGARLEPDTAKKRPTPYPLETRIFRNLHHFAPIRQGWHDALQPMLARLRAVKGENPPVPAGKVWTPKYESGVILAGEKLLADGSLPEMQQEFHERVRAAEMEGAGFARSCKEYGVSWLVFRGISDYGDPKKRGAWQTTAALGAASVARLFLQKEYRLPEEPPF